MELSTEQGCDTLLKCEYRLLVDAHTELTGREIPDLVTELADGLDIRVGRRLRLRVPSFPVAT